MNINIPLPLFCQQVMQDERVTEPPSEGVYIEGLQLDNATWNQKKGIIASQNQSSSGQPLPLIWIKPTVRKQTGNDQNVDSLVSNIYNCPLCVNGEKLLFDIPLNCQQSQDLFLAHSRACISSVLL